MRALVILLFTGIASSLTLRQHSLQRLPNGNHYRVIVQRRELLMHAGTSTTSLPDNSKKQLHDEVRKVAIPALAACIVEPALSLVDTYFVGKSTLAAVATLGLAGMSINGALFNIIAAATSPLGTGTTAVISKLRGEEEEMQAMNTNTTTTPSSNTSQVGTLFLNGIALSASIGVILSSAILLGGKSFLRHAFDIRQVDFLTTATSYFRIRGLSLPSVLINLVVFGFSIAVQDVVAPILSIVTAFWVNVVGDWLLCGVLGQGLTGAAIATTLSSYLGSLLALRHLFLKYTIDLPRVGDGRRIDWNRLFDRKGLQLFFAASGPLFAGAVANTLTYSAGARVTAFTTNAIVMNEIASHQIVMGSWWFLSFFSSPFSLVGQAILPKDLNAKRNDRARQLIVLLLRSAGVVATATTAVNVALLWGFPTLFTQNPAVHSLLQSVGVQSSVSLGLICLATVMDGLFIGCGRLGDYVKASVLSTATAWLYYALVAIPQKQGLVGTWNGLLIFCLTRFLYFGTRLGGLLRQIVARDEAGRQ